jgi:hypothetical protein
MSSAYELLQKHAEKFKQLYTVLRFACRCDHVTALIMQTYEPATAFLAAKNSVIRIYDLGAIDPKVGEVYNTIANDLEVDFVLEQGKGEIEETDLLYINTPAEGNYRAMELGRYAAKVKKYIILPNTVANGLTAAPTIKLADNVQPIGLVHGINHFLQSNDDWFIMEHDDLDPGMTVLVNRKNVANAYS